MKKGQNWSILVYASIPFLLLLFIVFLGVQGFYTFEGTETSAKLVGSALTLVGGLVASIVTLIGLLLRQSIERRNASIKEDSENRLKLEAALKAVSLLGTESGGNSAITQRTGAIFTLSHLGFHDLAIDLLFVLTSRDLIEPSSISSILNLCFKSNDDYVVGRAALFIRQFPEKLLIGIDDLEWPDALKFEWPPGLSLFAKYDILEGFIRIILSRPKADWPEQYLNFFVAILYCIFRFEQKDSLKAEISAYLSELIRIYPENDPQSLFLNEEEIKISTIRKDLEYKTDSKYSNLGKEYVDKLNKWREFDNR